MTTSSNDSRARQRARRQASAAADGPHPPEVLAGQSPHGHRDGVYFESAFASAAKKPIDGVVLQAALAERGWSALALAGDPKRPARKPQTLEATWLVSARLSQAALEAAVAQAVAELPVSDGSDELDDWLQDFTQSGQGASFELEHFKGWSAAQWFDHEFGDIDDGEDDDDDEDDDDVPVATTHANDVATKTFATFPAALQDTLARSRQVYVLRSEQASDEGAAWQPTLAAASEAIVNALGEITGSVELFELGKNRWAYRVW
ncbi:MAG TPA: hypothetical protein VFY73_11345 [Ideonella sp.]|uniref:hypothetical protein n=1 Tax=Ideonella sp. TaxID=1929293 RepID=UPI002E3055F1|nr:hypothetical protein [Ideonella sp.]HEX5684615.1 hypothetical protein [Ideonella sp.]